MTIQYSIDMATNYELLDRVEARRNRTIGLKNEILQKLEQIENTKSECEQLKHIRCERLQHKFLLGLRQLNITSDVGLSSIRFGTWNINSYDLKKKYNSRLSSEWIVL